MPADVVIKSVPAVRLAELSGTAESYEPDKITPVIQPLYVELCERLDKAGLAIIGPAIAYYEQVPEGVRVHAGAPVNLEHGKTYDFDVVDLPAVEQVATIVHHGPMDAVGATFQQLGRWIEENGYRSSGFAREVYLKYGDGDPETWVTELQETVTRSA